MTTKYLGLTALTATLVLAACGGGGGDSGNNEGTVANTPPATTAPGTPVTPTPAPAPVTASAEGVYEGTLSGGLSHLSLVTDTGRLFSIVGTTTGGVFGITRFLEGIGTSNNGTFTAADVHEYGLNASTANGSFNGTYVAATSLNGVLTLGGVTTTITGTALTNTTYVYNTPAKVANITGAWTLKDLTGANVALTVAADGKFTGTSGTCAITGSLTPNAAGKNLFTFTVVSGLAPCPRPNDVTTGVAVEFVIGATRQLIAAGSGVTRVNGTGWVGAR